MCCFDAKVAATDRTRPDASIAQTSRADDCRWRSQPAMEKEPKNSTRRRSNASEHVPYFAPRRVPSDREHLYDVTDEKPIATDRAQCNCSFPASDQTMKIHCLLCLDKS